MKIKKSGRREENWNQKKYQIKRKRKKEKEGGLEQRYKKKCS